MKEESRRSRSIIRKGRLGDAEPDDLAGTTAEERVGMMWQLALNAWAFMGEPIDAGARLQRHVVRIVRRGR